ncbi:MAG: NUDIX domain-containing protein [Patescibacteria group bacterium]|jgi:8-oxo-dGTP pyrophosphatase MutT (NUDIX family)
MIREKSAGVIVCRRHPKDDLQYLLLYMGNNYWNFPKGHVEEGESEAEGALRELEEETGIKNVELFPDFRQQTHFFFKQNREGKSELIKKDFILYLAEATVDIVVDITDKQGKNEVINGYAWMDFQTASKYLKFKNLKEIMAEADYYINSKKFQNEA